jgi:hypothetical protein
VSFARIFFFFIILHALLNSGRSVFQVDFSGTVKYGTFICHSIHFRRNRIGQYTRLQQYTVQHVSKSQ